MPDADQSAADRQAVQRLLEGRLQPDGVERDVELAAAGDLGDLVVQRLVARVERVVGADLERPVQHGGLDVDGDDRRRADEAGQLDDVGADAADAPHADRFADADLAGAHHRAERRRHRVGQDRRLLERHVVGNPGQPEGLRHGVLGPPPS